MKAGTKVYFGRPNGEKTLGKVVKVNRKTVIVETLEGRGTHRDYPGGSRWKVPLSLCSEAEPSGRSEADILRDIRNVHCGLSPENLHCDGVISREAARRKERHLLAELQRLTLELGRIPSDSEIYAY